MSWISSPTISGGILGSKGVQIPGAPHPIICEGSPGSRDIKSNSFRRDPRVLGRPSPRDTKTIIFEWSPGICILGEDDDMEQDDESVASDGCVGCKHAHRLAAWSSHSLTHMAQCVRLRHGIRMVSHGFKLMVMHPSLHSMCLPRCSMCPALSKTRLLS